MNNANILLIEDNDADIDLIKYSFNKNHIQSDLMVINDGKEALDYLMGTCIDKPTLAPDLIILDINLPKISGLEILKKLKENTITRPIITVILTTSNSEYDIQKAYEYYVNAYLVKPVEVKDYIDVIMQMEKFMIQTINRPIKIQGRRTV